MMIDSFTGEYFFLSNFSPSLLVIGGRLYLSVEHGYQAAKAIHPAAAEHIRQASSPGEAKKRGRLVVMRDDWEDVKLEVMSNLLRAKFLYPDLRLRLDATAGHTLVEGNHWGDTYWGVCRGEGENHLGKLLMQIRDYE